MAIPLEISSAPTNGTSGSFAGTFAVPGALLSRLDTAELYVNTGTFLSPVWSKAPKRAVAAQTFNATQVFDASTGDILTVICTANITSSSIINAITGQILTIVIIQDGTGSRTVAWPANVKWGGGSAPTLTTTLNKRDAFQFYYDGTNFYELSTKLNL